MLRSSSSAAARLTRSARLDKRAAHRAELGVRPFLQDFSGELCDRVRLPSAAREGRPLLEPSR